MPLVRVAEAFDHPAWLFELKHDGFRALAQVDGHHCTLVSRRRHVYRQFPRLQVEIAHSIRAHSAVLDGEIVCSASDGRSVFNRLLFRHDRPHSIAFDVLSIDGEDLRNRRTHAGSTIWLAVLTRPGVARLIRFASLNDDMLPLRPDVAAL
jgi:ATP-dependent DNA ligase